MGALGKMGKRPWLKYFSLGLLPIALVMFFGLWMNLTENEIVRIEHIRRGVWDLREHEFSEDNFYYLGGDLERFYGALISPQEFDYRIENNMPPNAPALWRTTTSRMRIYFPEDEETWYTFSRLSIHTSQRVYVNGVWMMDVGRPAYTAAEYVPEQTIISFTAKPVDGVIEIVQQSANFDFIM
ncbi:MAG: hypothetical protein LBE35_02115, partial [Clostridiales bacterium]|nr:hypothetical protein [Clostridiales bacterium]